MGKVDWKSKGKNKEGKGLAVVKVGTIIGIRTVGLGPGVSQIYVKLFVNCHCASQVVHFCDSLTEGDVIM